MSAAVVALVPAGSGAAVSRRAAPWRTHAIREVGSMSLPRTWRDFTRKRGLEVTIQRASAANPRVVPLLYALMVPMGRQVKFVAADLARRSLAHDFVTNVTVLAQRSPLTLDAWGARTLVALRRAPTVVGPVRRGYLRLPAGRALVFRYVQRVQAGSGRKRVAITEYALTRNGIIDLLIFSTTPAQRPAYARVFLRSARTLRLG